MNIYGSTAFSPGAGDGLAGQTIPGSGSAVPAGIEAVLEYNGLLMNVQADYDYYKITGIDGLGDADVRDTRDVNTEWDGETPFNAFYGGRTIVISGEIITYSIKKMRDMQMALKTAFADIKTEKPLHFRLGDYSLDHVIFCKKAASLQMGETQQNLRITRDFQISLRASDPRFYSYYQKHFYGVPNYSIGAPYVFTTLVNNGNYNSNVNIRVWGPSITTTITNDTTGDDLTLTDIPMVDAGNWVYYDFDAMNRTLKDQAGTNRWDHLADDSDYIALQGVNDHQSDGHNVITVETDSPRIEFSWYDAWM